MMGREKVPKEICGKRSSGRDQNENIMHRDKCSSEIDEFRKNDTTKKINDSKDCKIGGEDIRSRCPHVISIGDLAKVKIPVAEQAKCSFCGNRVPARWICLHVDCLESSVSCVTLCGSKEGERCHACKHYANNIEHCLLLNLVNSRLYCMCCETEVFREYNQPALPLEVRRALMPLKKIRKKSCSNAKFSSVSDKNTKENVPSMAEMKILRTRGRRIDTFAIVNRPVLKEMEDGFEDEFPKGLTGLCNLGNTCYFNAAVQVLSNSPPFSDYFRDKGDLRPYSLREPQVSNSLAFLIQKIWSPQREPVVSPKALLSRVRDNFPQFRGWNQQDSQELIRCLLELIHRELGQPVYPHEEYQSPTPKASTRHSSTSSNVSDQFETADSGWSSDGDTPSTSTDSQGERFMYGENEDKRKKTAEPLRWRSIVTDVFDGWIESSVTCLTCNNVSTTTETFQDLSLSIPSIDQLNRMRMYQHGQDVHNDTDLGTDCLQDDESWWSWLTWLRSMGSLFVAPVISLEDCLAAFFSPDRLVGDDMYSCDKCKKLRNGVKTCRVSRLPEVLSIHIKRFRHDSYSSSKMSTRVSFPLMGLDLSPFAASSEDISQFDLCGFVTHEGTTAESGHYLAYCRNEVDGNWYEFDDSTVTKLDSAYVLTKEAYVLFYQKRPSAQCEEARSRIHQMISPEAIIKANSHLYISSEWLLRLNTFSQPGPVSNYDFLCRHGHLLPRRAEHISSLCTPVPAHLGQYLINRFGGGPIVSELHYCLVCSKHWHWLQEKRSAELAMFGEVEESVRAAIYCGFSETLYSFYLPPSLINRAWFQAWERFINESCAEPPPAIDNSPLLTKAADGTIRLKSRVNYIRIARETFLLLQRLYGGGPEVFLMDKPQFSEGELRELLKDVEDKIKLSRNL